MRISFVPPRAPLGLVRPGNAVLLRARPAVAASCMPYVLPYHVAQRRGGCSSSSSKSKEATGAGACVAHKQTGTGCSSRASAVVAGSGSAWTLPFWSSTPVWRRALVNTLRCLVGCTVGDFSAMWYLQAAWPHLGMGPTMGISMAAGISTSLLLETTLLRYGKDALSWPRAARTAAAMSFISMLTMEMAENAVDYSLTGGVVDLTSPAFWGAAAVSITAGLLAPLPYNYHRLRRYGKACH